MSISKIETDKLYNIDEELLGEHRENPVLVVKIVKRERYEEYPTDKRDDGQAVVEFAYEWDGYGVNPVNTREMNVEEFLDNATEAEETFEGFGRN